MLEKLNIKYLIRAHTVIGLFCIFLFYISSFFGSITFFLPYVNQWELPSTHIEKTLNYTFNIDNKLNEIINKYKLDEKNIEITPPSFKDPRISISSKDQSTIFLNPNTNEELDTFYENNSIAEFINEIHFGENIPLIGTFLMGLSSTAILFLILSGIILFISTKKKRKQNQTPKRFWFKWHRNLGLIIIPFLLIFTITGAFIGMMLNTSTIFSLNATDYKESNLRKLVSPILFKQKDNLEKNEINTQMLDLSILYKKAQENYENLEIKKINIYNYNKENSQIVFSGYLRDNRALSGNINRVNITLNSINAQVLSKTYLEQTHGIKQTLSAFYFLHFMPDETIGVRVLFFVLGVLLLISLVFGYLLWAQKKLHNIDDFRLSNFINRVMLTIVLASFTCVGFLFFTHYLINNEFLQKDLFIKGMFYILFFILLFYSFFENRVSKIVKVNLYLSSVFFFFSAFIHGFQTKMFIWDSYAKNIDVIFYVDLILILSSIILFFTAKKISLNFMSNFNYDRGLKC